MIKSRQEAYYQVLGNADKQAEATPFIEFMLSTLNDALDEALQSDQVADQVTDQVKYLLTAMNNQSPQTATELMGLLKEPLINS